MQPAVLSDDWWVMIVNIEFIVYYYVLPKDSRYLRTRLIDQNDKI